MPDLLIRTPSTTDRLSLAAPAPEAWTPFALVLEEHPDREGELREVWASENTACHVVKFDPARSPARSPAASPATTPAIAPGWQQREAFADKHGTHGRRP